LAGTAEKPPAERVTLKVAPSIRGDLEVQQQHHWIGSISNHCGLAIFCLSTAAASY